MGDKEKILTYIQKKQEQLDSLNKQQKNLKSTTNQRSKSAVSEYEKLEEELGPTDFSDVLEVFEDINFFYTDWKDFSKKDAIAAGIVGPDVIKEHIRLFAEKNNL